MPTIIKKQASGSILIEHASGGKPGYIRTHSPNQLSFSTLTDKGTPYLFISSDGKNVVREKMADTTVISKDGTSQTMTPENYGDLTGGLLESPEDGEGGDDKNGGKIVYQGSLVDTGAVVNIAIDNLNIEVTRINATELGAIIRSSEILSIPTTRRATAASSVESWRKVIESSASGTVFDSITVGTYILVEYWVTYKDKKYYVVAGSDDNELKQAWIEIYEGFIL